MVAEARFQNGEFKNAGDLFHELTKIDPNNVGFVIRRKECFENDNNIPKAIKLIEDFTAKNPKNYFMQMELAGLYERQSEEFSAFCLYDELSKTPNPFRAEAKEKFDFLKREMERKKAIAALKESADPGSRREDITGTAPATLTSDIDTNNFAGNKDRNFQNQINSNSSASVQNPPSEDGTQKTGAKAPGAGSKDLLKKLSALYD